MKKSKLLLVALLGALTVSGCTPKTSSPATSSSTTPNTTSSTSSVDVNQRIAEELIARIILPENNTTVLESFVVPSTVTAKIDGTDYTADVVWTSDNDAVSFSTEGGVTTAVVTRPEKGQDDVKVVLTASITVNGKTASKTQKVTVAASTASATVWGEMKGLEVASWNDWYTCADNTDLAIQGIVTGYGYASSYKDYNIFLEDENGGYYLYGVNLSSEEIAKYCAIGNEIRVECTKTTYSGLIESVNDSVTGIEIINAAPAGYTLNPRDVTDIAKSSAEELGKLQSVYGTALGTFTVQDGYNYIQVGANKYQLYHSEKYNYVNFDEVTEQIATLAEGDTVRVTGNVGYYNGAQFYPRNIVKSDETITVTPEEKISIAKSEVFANFEDLYEEAAEVTLWASSDAEVTVAYALNDEANTDVFALGTDKLTITPTEAEEKATITATFTCGSVTDTATFEITAALPATNVESYVLTAEKLGLINSYGDGSKKVNGVEWGWIELGNYGNGIQMRNKNGKKSSLFNIDATIRPIKEIKLTYNSSNKTYDNENVYTFSFGTDNTLASYSTQFSFKADVKEYTITPDTENYTYFKLEYNDSYTYSSYWDSIEVVLVDPVIEKFEITPYNLLGYTNENVVYPAVGTHPAKKVTYETQEVTFEYCQVSCYGDGLQFRIKDTDTSYIYNSTPFAKEIESITIVPNAKWTNVKASFGVSFGTEAVTEAPETYAAELVTTGEGYATQTITCDVDGATYFRVGHIASGGVYIDKIIVNYKA